MAPPISIDIIIPIMAIKISIDLTLRNNAKRISKNLKAKFATMIAIIMFRIISTLLSLKAMKRITFLKSKVLPTILLS